VIIAGTGHRPEKMPAEGTVRLQTYHSIKTLPGSVFISGMAAGFDLWAADVIQSDLEGWDVWCAVPFKGHKPRAKDEKLYNRVLSRASQVVYVDESTKYPGPWVYQKRNEWMVDHADRVLAYWDGTEGGTCNCVKYAKEKKVPVRNIVNAPPF
jgi:uncharacterized phage-like protein YoqJ